MTCSIKCFLSTWITIFLHRRPARCSTTWWNPRVRSYLESCTVNIEVVLYVWISRLVFFCCRSIFTIRWSFIFLFLFGIEEIFFPYFDCMENLWRVCIHMYATSTKYIIIKMTKVGFDQREFFGSLLFAIAFYDPCFLWRSIMTLVASLDFLSKFAPYSAVRYFIILHGCW